jgi:CheY-like chemotaxis protein
LIRRIAYPRSPKKPSRRQAEAANRAKDEFLAMVSHKLRTPLSALLDSTRLLSGGKLNAQEMSHAIQAVERSAKTQVQLVGAEVIESASAGEAIQALRVMRPDVLVSDMAMPGEDGFALIRRVRALGPEFGGQIPAVAVTAMAMKNDQQILAAGYQKHLLKPVEPDELVSAVASVVS